MYKQIQYDKVAELRKEGYQLIKPLRIFRRNILMTRSNQLVRIDESGNVIEISWYEVDEGNWDENWYHGTPRRSKKEWKRVEEFTSYRPEWGKIKKKK